MSNLNLAVMAAGVSNRFGRLKQLEPVGPSGETLLDYSLHDARKHGFEKIYFIVSQDSGIELRERLKIVYKDELEFEFVEQKINDIPPEYTINPTRVKPWGTAHAIYALRRTLKEPFALINSDDYYGPTGFEQMAGHLSKISNQSSYFSMVGYELKDTLSASGPVSRAVCEVKNEQICRIDEALNVRREKDGRILGEICGEEMELDEAAPVSMNMWAITPKIYPQLEKGFQEFLMDNIFDEDKEFPFPDVINHMLGKQAISVQMHPACEKWFGLTFSSDTEPVRRKLSELHKQGIYPAAGLI